MNRKIAWDNNAKAAYYKIIKFIRKESPQNSLLVENAINSMFEFTAEHPEFHRPDKYRLENDKGAFRAFELKSIRVSFFFDENILLIVRIRHTKQEPLNY